MHHRPSPAPRVPGRALRRSAAAVAAALLLLPAAASAQSRSTDDVASELDATQRRASELQDRLGGVQARIEDTEEELAQLGVELERARGQLRAAEGQVALGEAALAEAEAERTEAERAHERAEAALARAEERLETEEATLVEQIVESFKYGTVGAQRGAMALEVLRRAHDPNGFAVGMKQLQVVVHTQESTVQAVFDLREERAARSDDAARARSRAAQAAADAAETLRVLERLREEAAALTTQVAEAEERQQVVLASLEADAAETEALLQRVDTRRAELSAELAEVEAAERRAQAARSGGGGAAGGPSLAGGYCPVVGAKAGRDFSNDWGYPRSGGRSHQGNDVFANAGTPVVAVAGGVVVRTNPVERGLGGLTVTYRTADGSEWYNAHLRDLAPGIAPGVSVDAGQTIGTVGNTGNARTTPPHLHIGRKYQGSWVNPYPTISAYC